MGRRRWLRFNAKNPANEVARLSADEIDELAFGAIQVDGSGNILLYNAAEGDISGRDPSQMVGKNFFKEVAPCTDTEAFEGRFRKGVESGHLDVGLNYTFDYNMKPTQVRIRMQKSPQDEDGDTYWIFVKRI